MCLLFYLAGLATGYVAWRISTAPRLWDAQTEADFWRNQWLKIKSREDLTVED
jgi:hypothetical protein